jgi:uncharacterized protein YacL
MNLSLSFIRTFFVFLSLLFVIGFVCATTSEITLSTVFFATLGGLTLGGLLLSLELIFRKFHLKAFNTTCLGLFFGYLMGIAVLFLFDGMMNITQLEVRQNVTETAKIFLFLSSCYLGVILTLRSSHELYMSIPFVKFTPDSKRTKEVLADLSSLYDGRILDIATTGLLDSRLVIPRFLMKELYLQEESTDEILQTKAHLALEIVRKLEGLPALHLRFQETDFPEVKESTSKILRLARLLDADVFSADINRVEISSIEGVRVVNIHALSCALKPLMQRGEYLTIKVQRPGKEERQGVGYLEDGTMVVVNGGGDFIGKAIKAYVLSVKHTTSGRMIFCNVAEEGVAIAAC